MFMSHSASFAPAWVLFLQCASYAVHMKALVPPTCTLECAVRIERKWLLRPPRGWGGGGSVFPCPPKVFCFDFGVPCFLKYHSFCSRVPSFTKLNEACTRLNPFCHLQLLSLQYKVDVRQLSIAEAPSASRERKLEKGGNEKKIGGLWGMMGSMKFCTE